MKNNFVVIKLALTSTAPLTAVKLRKTSRIVQDFREVTGYEEIILSIEKYFIYLFEHFCSIQLPSRKPLVIREASSFRFLNP